MTFKRLASMAANLTLGLIAGAMIMNYSVVLDAAIIVGDRVGISIDAGGACTMMFNPDACLDLTYVDDLRSQGSQA